MSHTNKVRNDRPKSMFSQLQFSSFYTPINNSKIAVVELIANVEY